MAATFSKQIVFNTTMSIVSSPIVFSTTMTLLIALTSVVLYRLIAPQYNVNGSLIANPKGELITTDTAPSSTSPEGHSRTLFGGGIRPRNVLSAELNGVLDVHGNAIPNAWPEFILKRVIPLDSLASQNLEPNEFPCCLSLLVIAPKLNVPEMKILAKFHDLVGVMNHTRALMIQLLTEHQCTSKCKISVAILQGVDTGTDVEHPSFVHGSKLFSPENLEPYIDPLAVVAGTSNFKLIRCQRTPVPFESLGPDDILVDNIEIRALLPKLSAHGLRCLGAAHNIVMRDRTSKDKCLQLLSDHVACNGCAKLTFVFTRLYTSTSRTTTIQPTPACVDNSTPYVWPEFDRGAVADWPPRPTTYRDIARAMKGYCDDQASNQIEETGCAVCGQLHKRTEMTALEGVADYLHVLTEPTATRHERTNEAQPLASMPGPVLAGGLSTVCPTCQSSLQQKIRPRMALANWLWLGDIPICLRDLTLAEQTLISRIRHNHCVIRVANGHTKMIANVVAFEQPTMKVYTKLPVSKSELNEVLAVLFTGISPPTADDLKRTPVLVRREKVTTALEWLKLNHSEYRDLTIDYSTLASYALEDVPVTYIYAETSPDDGNLVAASKSVFDNEGERGTVSGPCPFTVHGLTGEQYSTMSTSQRKATAIRHLQNGGAMMGVGHDPNPQSIYHNPTLYPSMFPWLFPFGLGGLGHDKHSLLISKDNHLRWYMLYHDKRFQTDANFVVIAFNHSLIKQASAGSFMMVKRNNFTRVAEGIRNVDPTVLASITERMKSGERVVPDSAEEKQCFALLDQIEYVGSHVDGSMSCKKRQRNEVWSLIAFNNTPGWFITFSPADNKHPICLYWASQDLYFKPEIKTSSIRELLATRNPVACARFFDHMVQLFIKHVCGWQSDGPVRGLFGKPSAYYGTVEQQGRMTLHLHFLLWIEGSPSPQEVRDRLMSEDSHFQTELIAYLESCQVGEFFTGSMDDIKAKTPMAAPEQDRGIHTILQETTTVPAPSPDYVDPTLTLPEPPPGEHCDADDCDCDVCTKLIEWYERFKSTFDDLFFRSNVHKCFGRRDNRFSTDGKGKGRKTIPKVHATGKGCINKEGVCTARFPRETRTQSIVNLETGHIDLKKGEEWVNNVTPTITIMNRCNTDTTSLLSGTAVKSTVAYVTDYLTKGWLKTYQLFNTMYEAFMKHSEVFDSEDASLSGARTMILKIVNALSAKMEMGAPMAALYLLQNDDHYTSHEFETFYWKNFTSFVEREWRTLIDNSEPAEGEEPMCDLDATEDVGIDRTTTQVNSENDVPASAKVQENVKISRARGAFVGKSSTDDYRFRPRQLENVCVYEWIQCSIRHKDSSARLPTRSLRFFQYLPEHPMADSYVVACDPERRHFVVPNFIGPALPRPDKGDREEYCRTMMTLFAPWRTGTDLKGADTTWEEAFEMHPFSQRHKELIANLNLRYECYDACDDFNAQYRKDNDDLMDDTAGPGDTEGVDPNASSWNDDDDDDNAVFKGPAARVLDHANEATRAQLTAAGWMDETEGDPVQNFERLKLPRLVIDGDFDSGAWRQTLRSEKEKILDAKFKPAVVPQNVTPESAPSGPVRNDVEVLPASYLSADFVPGNEYSRALIERLITVLHLNVEQQRAFRIVANHGSCVAPEQLLLYMGGMGGTGKTTVIKALIKYFEGRKEPHRLVLLGPTGTASALIGGTTYHTFLGFQRSSTTNPQKSIEDLRDRLKRVGYIFIDELSMIGCVEFCRISARLCDAMQRYDKPFGGLNVILAGDFAQLPPTGALALYSRKVSLNQSPRQKLAEQEATIGKAIWLQFTSVVILKQNMRQTDPSPDEQAFRRALENLRYHGCTQEDIALLRSRVATLNPALSVQSSLFRNVSIITAQNRDKDEINRTSSVRFARELGKPLRQFFSYDELSNSDDVTERPTRFKKRVYSTAKRLTKKDQNELWSQPPHTSDNIPACLSICRGMPVIIRYNQATELCITRGQEGRIVGWTSRRHPRYREKDILDVVYLELINAPKVVKVPGLPVNVVPITPHAEVVSARLPSDLYMKVKRTQVPVLPNFAMTDYSAQGKTRIANVVDISNCRDFQGVYTCLSRGVSLKGTLILRDFQDTQVRDTLDGALRQEFRELNYLDIVTTLRYEGKLPPGILQPTRLPTVTAYRAWKNTNEEHEWHSAIRHDGEFDNIPPTDPEMAIETIAGSLKRKAVEDAGGGGNPVKKRQRRAFRLNPLYVIPTGPIWDRNDYSCAYDVWTTIFHWLWHGDQQRWARVLSEYSDTLTEFVKATEAQKMEPLGVNLSLVRDVWRAKIRQAHPNEFNGTRGTDIVSLVRHLLGLGLYFPSTTVVCKGCGRREPCGRSSRLHLSRLNVMLEQSSISGFVYDRLGPEGQCPVCHDAMYIEHFVDDLVCFDTTNVEGISVDTTIVIGKHGTYQLVGAVYYSDFHFVSRVICANQKVFMHDGMSGTSAVFEGELGSGLSNAELSYCGPRPISFAIYARNAW